MLSMLESDEPRNYRELPPLTRKQKLELIYWWVMVPTCCIVNLPMLMFGLLACVFALVPILAHIQREVGSVLLFGFSLITAATLNGLAIRRNQSPEQGLVTVLAILADSLLLLIGFENWVLSARQPQTPWLINYWPAIVGGVNLTCLYATWQIQRLPLRFSLRQVGGVVLYLSIMLAIAAAMLRWEGRSSASQQKVQRVIPFPNFSD